MAAVFTPGLCVTERTLIQKERRLPLAGEVQVSLGQRLAADDVVARTELPGKVYPVNLAQQLGVPAGQIRENLVIAEGDAVEFGQVVARTNGLWGLFRSEAKSIVTGTLQSVSRVTGQAIFQAAPVPIEIDAYIEGRVVEVMEGEGCVVQAEAALVQGIFGLGGEVRGEVTPLEVAPDVEVRAQDLSEVHAGQVVVGGAYFGIDALRRAAEVGVAAVVTGGFDYDDIATLLGHEVRVAITGDEQLGLTLVVTEGFGHIPMTRRTWELLAGCAGRRASVNGSTQIRAGVIRPEVVVTWDVDVPQERVAPEEPAGISIGDTIRGIRVPFFGRIGEVVDLPVEPVVLETESQARVMRVQFTDGEVAVLPRANVETIEG